jgi:signal transduction histidine kinase
MMTTPATVTTTVMTVTTTMMTTDDPRVRTTLEIEVPRSRSAGWMSARRPRWFARLLGDARTRVLVWFIAVVALAVVGSVLVGRQALLARLETRIDGELRQEVEELRRLASGVDPATGAPFADDVERIFDVYVERNVGFEHERLFLYVAGAPYRPARLPATYQPPEGLQQRWAELRSPQRGQFASGVGTVDYLALPLEGQGRPLGVFVMTIYGDFERAEIGGFVRTMSMVGVAAVAVASVLAWFGAGRILAPIRRLTDTAETISDRHFAGRIEVSGDDDVARLARTFNAMLDRLQQSFATQRRFLNDVGHELRTPITIVRGHLDVLGDDPEERAETVALVTDELERMRRLVDDLVVLAKAEQPDFLEPAPIDFAELITEIARKAERLADRAWRLETTDDGVIFADRQRLTQAMVQLAQNAVEQTEPGDVIALGSAMVDGRAHLWVRDSGPGLQGADPQRLFERFAGDRREGTGLGLSIVQAIARAHAGEVDARNAPGGGAIFTIWVPQHGPESFARAEG